jgi:uncharacterized protein
LRDVHETKVTMGIFGDFDVRLDPWEVEYGPEFPLNVTDEQNAEEVVLDVEVPASEWKPIIPSSPDAFSTLFFVDGVRRIEARLLVSKNEQLCHGAFGSAAVGAVRVTSAGARCETTLIDRIVAFGSGVMLPEPIRIAQALVYEPATWPEPEVDGPLRAVQKRMRDVEEAVVRRLGENEEALVIADGPLSYEHPVNGSVLGYIKRVHNLYLPTKYLSVVSALPIGGRTPLFVLIHMKRGRYSWFQRIGAKYPGDSNFSGIVRMEVSTQVGVAAARRLADSAAQILPRFVPTRGRDPRAPQNLLPIGALESHLRRCLGDSRLARRRIQSLIASEARNAGL